MALYLVSNRWRSYNEGPLLHNNTACARAHTHTHTHTHTHRGTHADRIVTLRLIDLFT